MALMSERLIDLLCDAARHVIAHDGTGSCPVLARWVRKHDVVENVKAVDKMQAEVVARFGVVHGEDVLTTTFDATRHVGGALWYLGIGVKVKAAQAGEVQVQ